MSDITVVVADSTPQNVVVSSSTPDITEVINVGPAGAGGGTSYDQSLNTTDSPTFVGVNTASGTLQGGVYPGFFADGHGFEMTHGDQNQGTIDVFAPSLSSGQSVSVTLPSASGTLAIGNQSLNTTNAPTFTGVYINDQSDGGGTFGSSGAYGNVDGDHGDGFSLNGSGVSFKIGENTDSEVPISHYGHGLIEYTTTSAGTKSFSLPSDSGTIATEESVATGYAPLVGGLVPAANLPSYVDDVLEYSAFSAFPTIGESGKIYLSTGTGRIYRWTGTIYAEVSPSTAQVQSDWTATSGLGQILNKPTLFSGSYGDLTGTPSLFSGSFTDLTNRAHAASHKTGGSDALTATDIGAFPNNGTAQLTASYYTKTAYPSGNGQSTGANAPSLSSPVSTLGTWAVVKVSGQKPRLCVNDSGTQRFIEFQTATFANVATSGAYGDLTGTPSTFSPSAHASSHASGGSDALTLAASQITDLATVATSGSASDLSTGTLPDARLSTNVVTLTGTQTLTNKSISSGQITGLGTAAAKDIPASGNASTTQVVYGSDTRLTDARTPTTHTHTLQSLSGTYVRVTSDSNYSSTDIMAYSGGGLLLNQFDGTSSTQTFTISPTGGSFAVPITSSAQTASSGSSILTRDLGDARYSQGATQTKKTSADIVSSNTTLADVTGLTGFSLEANTTYRFEFTARMTIAGSCSFQVILSSTAALANPSMSGWSIATGTRTDNGFGNLSATNYYFLQKAGSATNNPSSAFYYVVTGSTAPTVKIQFSQQNTTVASGATLLSGAVASFTKLI